MTRAEEIAAADAELSNAVREMYAKHGSLPTHPRAADALKARAALDEPPKPRLRTPDLLWEWWNGQPHNFSVIVNEMRREIAELVRAELHMAELICEHGNFFSVSAIDAARDRIIAVLTST